jgi:hypothetical protein
LYPGGYTVKMPGDLPWQTDPHSPATGERVLQRRYPRTQGSNKGRQGNATGAHADLQVAC